MLRQVLRYYGYDVIFMMYVLYYAATGDLLLFVPATCLLPGITLYIARIKALS
jgi:hypothetical protein